MAFLDRLGKGVSRAANQAKFEADKVMRVNKLSSEASELARQVEQLTVEIGRKAIELVSIGQFDVPEMTELAAQVKAVEATLAAKRGIIALQMHPGPPMKVQFKNIRIKILDTSKSPAGDAK